MGSKWGKSKAFIHCFSLAAPWKAGHHQVKSHFRRQTLSKITSLLSRFLELSLIAWHHKEWDIPLANWSQHSWLCLLSDYFLQSDRVGKSKSLSYIQALTRNDQNIGVLLRESDKNPKHSSIWAAMKTIPPRPDPVCLLTEYVIWIVSTLQQSQFWVPKIQITVALLIHTFQDTDLANL